jgi:shikimate dehydrogenase
MSTERYAVIGDPIDHSLSPAMQTAAFRAAGIDASYQAVRVGSVELAGWMNEARTRFQGFNVTIPHKEDAARLMDVVDDTARYVDAVNTVKITAGLLHGFNTDVVGFVETVREMNLDVSGRQVVIFGAGGSARAVVWALQSMGARVTIINRTAARAKALASAFIGAMPTRPTTQHIRVLNTDDAETTAAIREAVLLVNTTPLGMKYVPGSPLPDTIPLDHKPAIIDLVYGEETPLVKRAREGGCHVLDGIEMLVQQGAASFRLWTERDPDLHVMRQACRTLLEER